MKIKEFLEEHKISPESLDIANICNVFLKDMENGLKKEPSSLPMIDSFCSPDYSVEPGKPIIVIDAGGTNFRTCLVTFDKDMKPEVTDFQNRPMPGSTAEVSAKEFFSIIADETERLIEKSDRIGFCFSYAATILPDHDGIPMMFSKEIKAPEVIGKHLGKELLSEFKKRGHDVSRKKIIILNDTVTTLLAGLTETEKLGCEGCIGFILGTGTNTAYIEKNTIINVESGCFKYELGDIDDELNASTKDPDKYHFEKMISGAYLGHTFKLVLQHAKQEGILSEGCVIPEDLDTPAMCSFKADDKSDNEAINTIRTNLISRAAKLTAANLAACVMKTEFGKRKPVLINADGTTFYKVEGLKDNTEKYLKELLDKNGRTAVFTKIEQSPILGSAIGALSL